MQNENKASQEPLQIKVTLNFKWGVAGNSVSTFVLRYGKLPQRIIKEIWSSLTPQQKLWCCRCQRVPKYIVEEDWPHLSSWCQPGFIKVGAVSSRFIARRWKELGWDSRWEAMRNIDLPVKFIATIWHELSGGYRKACWENSLASKLTLEQLPPFLTDSDPVIRGLAVKLTKKLKAKVVS
jgi:hypothetical protein